MVKRAEKRRGLRHERDRSAGVIVYHRGPEGCRFLLVLSGQTKRPLWEFPKGGVDPGETLLDAALRELHEETGLTTDDVELVPNFRREERYRFMTGPDGRRKLVHKQVTYFLARSSHRDVVIAPDELLQFAWLELGEARRRLRYVTRRRILDEAAGLVGCD